MVVESKPLFHPEVMRQQMRSLTLPEHVPAWLPKLQHWAGLIASGRADDFKETALLPDFLTDIFCGLPGDTGSAATTDTYSLSRERHVEVGGRSEAHRGKKRPQASDLCLSGYQPAAPDHHPSLRN
jgi:hypothetical protein